MIYRKLTSPAGDYTFGKGSSNFFKNTPETVAQAIKTRLGLSTGEWFLDINEGTPYNSQIMGAGAVSKYDAAIQGVVLGTQGVLSITDYASNVDPATRKATVSCTVNTLYGATSIINTFG